MQQGMKKMPERRNARDQVNADLEKLGINVTRDLSGQLETFQKTTDNAERSRMVNSLVSRYTDIINRIENVRENNSIIRNNDKPNSEYQKEMDALLTELKEGLQLLVNAQFEYGKVAGGKTEFQRERPA